MLEYGSHVKPQWALTSMSTSYHSSVRCSSKWGLERERAGNERGSKRANARASDCTDKDSVQLDTNECTVIEVAGPGCNYWVQKGTQWKQNEGASQLNGLSTVRAGDRLCMVWTSCQWVTDELPNRPPYGDRPPSQRLRVACWASASSRY